MENAKQFLEYLVKQLAEEPDSVFVETRTDEMGILLTLHVSKIDMGKIIGKEGQTAKAIRTLLRVVGMKEKAHVNMKIAEPDGSDFSKKPTYADY